MAEVDPFKKDSARELRKENRFGSFRYLCRLLLLAPLVALLFHHLAWRDVALTLVVLTCLAFAVWRQAQALNRAARIAAELRQSATATKLTGRGWAEKELQFLADAGRVLNESLDYRATLANLAKLAVPRFADWCLIDMVSPGGEIERLEAVNATPPTEINKRLLLKTPNPPAMIGVPKVLRTGQSELYEAIHDQLLTEVAVDAEHLEILRSLNVASGLIVPIKARGRIFGAMTFLTTDSKRAYSSQDATLGEELAGRAALAVDNALLYRAAQDEIAERRQAEIALRETEERFRLIVDRTREYAIFLLDIRGYVSSWNPGAERILGYKEEEIIGQYGALLFTASDQAARVPEEELARAQQTGEALDERWHVRKDGTRFFASGFMIGLRDDHGRLRGFAKIMRDLTDAQQAKEDIQKLNHDLERRVEARTAALTETNEQMEAFCYTVAHDLRAPLRAMQGFSHALIEDYSDKIDSAGQDFIRRILGSAQRMDLLIQDLLAYSRLSRADLKFESVDLEVIVETVLRTYDEEIKKRKSLIKVGRPLPLVWGHRSTVEQVLANLISNGLKFVNPGVPPEIEIRTEPIGEFIRIIIQDKGIGIALEHQDRIFRVFERLYGIESYPGTGIGLAIVRKGVERMGGAVGLLSKPGKGSTFWVDLPKNSLAAI